MTRPRLLKDWPLKLLALALATVIWLQVVGEERYIHEVDVPLELQNMPAELTFLEDPPNSVTVRLRAPRAVLERIKPGEVDAQVDMSDAKSGGNLLQLTKDDIRVPFGVEIVSVSPPSIRMDIQRKTTKRIPVIPDVRGQPPEGFELRGVGVNPKEVEVEGPEEIVNGAIEASTEAVYLSGRTSSFVEKVNIDPKTTKLRLVDSAAARVEIVIDEITSDRTFDAIPVQIRPVPESYVPEPPEVSVTVSGPYTTVQQLTDINIRAFVDLDLSDDTPLRELEPVVVFFPAELGSQLAVTEVRPSKVQITASAAETASRADPAPLIPGLPPPR